jgi:hypothetical protein
MEEEQLDYSTNPYKGTSIWALLMKFLHGSSGHEPESSPRSVALPLVKDSLDILPSIFLDQWKLNMCVVK